MINLQPVVVRPKISSTDEDPVGKGLAKYGMSKFAGCPDIHIGAAYDRNLGRYLTGLDETHPDILALPQEERLKVQADILEERAQLEMQMGHSLHYTNEDFWSSVPIKLDRGIVYNPKIPRERIIIFAIIAGKLAPTNKSDIGNPDYLGTHFYVGAEFEDVSDRNASRHKERDLAFSLKAVLDNFDYAVVLGKYLNIAGISDKIPLANLDDLISDWLEKKAANKEAFLAAVKEKEEFIRLSVHFREFKRLNLVRWEDGKWFSGKVRLGKSEKEAVKKLISANADMQAELANLVADYEDKTGIKI